MSHYKRGRGLGDLGGNTYDQTISSGLITRTRDSIHYDTNILVTTSVDSGVTTSGAHGRYARFRDTRLQPLLGSTGDYTVALVRGTVTTNDIPLFCPKPSKLITENDQKFWEVGAEPGLAYTWTGPVYTTETNSSILPALDLTLASWPTTGCIPFYVATTLPATGNGARIKGFIDCSTLGSSNDTTAANVVSRLNTLFSNAGLGILTVTVPAAGVSTTTQYYSFVNSSTSRTVYLDFTLPASYGQQNGQIAQNYANATHPSKRGILQACKILGFVPNTVFVIPAAVAPAVSSTVVAPRAYQLAFRNTVSLYAYKTVRWVPEDQGVFQIPTEQEVKDGNSTSPTYFDCYSYQHFLNECINPTFQRVIYDPFDNNGTIPLSEQCLQRQIQAVCAANCNTGFWSSSLSYSVGDAVTFNGRAYYALYANNAVNPSINPSIWMDCGTSIVSSYVPGQRYYTGDVVTYATPASSYPAGLITVPGTAMLLTSADPSWVIVFAKATSTFSVPATTSALTATIVLVGSGGSGGSGVGNNGGGGGSAGQVVVTTVDLKPNRSYTYTRGTAGGVGVNGGNATFAPVTAGEFAVITALGGKGGGSNGLGGAGNGSPAAFIDGGNGLSLTIGGQSLIIGAGGGAGTSGTSGGRGGVVRALVDINGFAGAGGANGAIGNFAAFAGSGGGGAGAGNATGGDGEYSGIYIIYRVAPYPTVYTVTAAGSTVNDPTNADWTATALGTYISTGSGLNQITPSLPAVATAAPYVTFNPSTQLFVLNLDSYGFGGTSATNVDDGYGGFIDDSVNAQNYGQLEINTSLNDQARDSWGLTGTAPIDAAPYTVARHPFRAYDEKLSVEVDDYFHQLFGNWPALRLLYIDPVSQVTTAYVRYLPQANAAGLAVSQPLPYVTPTIATTPYLPYGRVAGNTPYIYTFPQDYPSVGLLWNPVDTLVVIAGEIPMLSDEVSPTFFLGDVFTERGSSNGNTLKILGEYVVKATNQVGQEYRNEIVFEPQAIVRCSLQSGTVFKTFDYQIMMRMKNSNALRPLTISNGGSVFMRFQFEIKAGI